MFIYVNKFNKDLEIDSHTFLPLGTHQFTCRVPELDLQVGLHLDLYANGVLVIPEIVEPLPEPEPVAEPVVEPKSKAGLIYNLLGV